MFMMHQGQRTHRRKRVHDEEGRWGIVTVHVHDASGTEETNGERVHDEEG